VSPTHDMRPVARAGLATLGHCLTVARLVASGWLHALILDGRFATGAVVLVLAMLSDLADGPLVRRYGTPSSAGAWFDILADLALVTACFAGFATAGVLPWWPLWAIGASFVMFAATSKVRLYDPFGRFIGAQLMLAALGVLLAPDLAAQLVLGTRAGLAALITLAVRMASTVRLHLAAQASR